MSLWNPLKSGDHSGIRRIWNHYGMPTVVADVVHMISLDGYAFFVFAGATYAPGEPPHTASAKAKDMASAKVIGAALAKMVRNNCVRAARRKVAQRAKANMELAISIADSEARLKTGDPARDRAGSQIRGRRAASHDPRAVGAGLRLGEDVT